MTDADAIWFRKNVLPIIREAAEDRGDGPDPLRSMLRQLIGYIDALDEILADVAAAGVELDDKRLRYVTLQIDRTTWELLDAWRER